MKDYYSNMRSVAHVICAPGILRMHNTRYAIILSMLVASLVIAPGCYCKDSSDGEALLKAGEQLYQEFNFSEAEAKFKESIKAFDTAGNKLGLARSLERLGNLNYDVGNYGQAVRLFGQSQKIYNGLQEHSAEAGVCGACGLAYQDWGDFPAALQYYKMSLLCKPTPQVQVQVEMRIGVIYTQLGDGDEAFQHLRVAQDAIKGGLEEKWVCDFLLSLGKAYEQAGHLSEAKEAYRNVLSRKGETRSIREALCCLGDLALTRKDHTEAETYFRQANFGIGLGRVALAQDQLEAALKYFQQALDEAERQGEDRQIFASQVGLGLVCLKQKKSDQGIAHLRHGLDTLEEMRKDLPMGRRLHFLETSTHGFSHIAVYELLTATLASQGKNEEAFQIAEYSKSRVLTEVLSAKEPLSQGSPVDSASDSTRTANDSKVSEESQSGPRQSAALEIMPLGKLIAFLQSNPGSYDQGALCSLFVRAIFHDFEASKQSEAGVKRESYVNNTDYCDAQCKEKLIKKLDVLRQSGVNNHLTSLYGSK